MKNRGPSALLDAGYLGRDQLQFARYYDHVISFFF